MDMTAETLPKPNDPFEWVQAPWGAALRCRPLAEIAPHYFTTRELRLEGVRDQEAAGWAVLSCALGVELDALVRLHQVHCADVFVAEGAGRDVPAANDGKPLPTPFPDWPVADIAVSDDPSLALSVRVADCVPILLADRRSGAVAAIHAGWKGTAAGAAMAAVRAMTSRFATNPADVIAAVGPSIGACCYEVGPDLFTHFSAHTDAATWFTDGARPRLDLWRATRDQLERAGVPAAAIHVAALCTFDHPAWFHSYRRDGTSAGRLVAAIRPLKSAN
jgi:YfiH family protein